MVSNMTEEKKQRETELYYRLKPSPKCTILSHIHVEGSYMQVLIQELTLVGAPWIGEGSGTAKVPRGSRAAPGGGGLGGQSTPEAHENYRFLLASSLLSLSLFFFRGGAKSAPA